MPDGIEGPPAGDEDELGVAVRAEEPAALRELRLRHQARSDDSIPRRAASRRQLDDLSGTETGQRRQHADATARGVHMACDHDASRDLPCHRATRPPADDTWV